MVDTPVIYQRSGSRPRLRHTGPIDPARRLTVLGVHGSGAVAGTFVSDVAGYQAVVDRAGAAVTPDWFGDNVRGSLCAYLWDNESGTVLVLPDPLAGGLVYVHESGDLTAVSSGLAELVGTLARLGRKPAKSLGFLAEVVATTNGGWAHPASYQGVDVLAPFEYLEIGATGVRRCTYRAAARLLDGSVPYRERLAAAAAEIRSNVAALATAGRDPKVLHLTAGFDSRLMLAAILEGGFADRVHFTCTGRSDTADKRVSAALAAEFGLTMTEGQGAPLAEHPRTLTDQVLWQMRAAYGMATVGPHRGYRPGGSVIGAGGYGEIARSFYSHRLRHLDQHDVPAVVGTLWGGDVLSLGPRGLLAPALVERVHAGLAERLAAAGRLGVRADARWDHLYLTGRNRYFVGEISRQWTPVAARFDPLYSLNAAALALSLPVDERSANLVGFDLMNQFCPALAELPFGEDRYTDTYRRLRGEPRRRPFTADRPPARVVPTFPVPPQPRDRETFPEPTAADRDLAERLRIVPAQAAGIGPMRAEVRRLAAEIGPDRLDTIVNRPVFDRFLRAEVTNRGRFRALSGLRTALLWYTDPDGITNRPRWLPSRQPGTPVPR
ncbi:hypothetical protein [Paractinoplanes rishiriensis]|nr:hypothetical protein [Actinoplanes rishiriensis]